MYLLFFLLWVIWNGRVTLEIVLFGLVISALLLFFASRLLGYSIASEKTFWRNLPILILYALNLILEVVKAAGQVASIAIHPSLKPDPIIVEFDSPLEGHVRNVILANSITLTPGTYTLSEKDGHFVVHCLRSEFAEGLDSSSFVRILGRLS